MGMFDGVKDAATEKLLRAAGPQMAEALERHTATLDEIRAHMATTTLHLTVTAANTQKIAEALASFNAGLLSCFERMDRLETAMTQVVITARDLQKWSRVDTQTRSQIEATEAHEHGQIANGQHGPGEPVRAGEG